MPWVHAWCGPQAAFWARSPALLSAKKHTQAACSIELFTWRRLGCDESWQLTSLWQYPPRMVCPDLRPGQETRCHLCSSSGLLPDQALYGALNILSLRKMCVLLTKVIKWLDEWVFSIFSFNFIRASLVAQIVKNLPAMQEIHVQSLGQEDPLEKRMTTHPGILAWRIPWTESDSLQSTGTQRVRYYWVTNAFTFNY